MFKIYLINQNLRNETIWKEIPETPLQDHLNSVHKSQSNPESPTVFPLYFLFQGGTVPEVLSLV